MKIVLTCEHAGNKIPKKYQLLFRKANSILNSHRGYDFGAYLLFKRLSSYSDFSKYTQISRLLIDTNRSLGNNKLYSEITKILPNEMREEIFNNYYLPYRSEVEGYIKSHIKKEKIFHFSLHTFTPILNSKIRDCDIGILFNPKNNFEKAIALNYRDILRQNFPKYRIRFNYPYKGSSDGFTTYLKERYSYKKYAGIELEVNQKLFKDKEIIKNINNSFNNLFKNLKT